ncbi:hypothetical protein CANARDRAFT_27620 [[Candida] arabinofermentans NRRL YB-2248]|uniref:Uncharacterized protein n=1 Tax=[Candida] arabinofermentans NRRL YB-2248 TaxID=983967 RepID=A0A1E4T3R9_9ASCO|nr:hypothetical protein CANARDRAFT_27620 [[Candida] arabinofermentans NRRL YB-2248]
MLQSKNLSLLLSQVLTPLPALTPYQTISISLVSLSTEQPLFSCIQPNHGRSTANANSSNITSDQGFNRATIDGEGDDADEYDSDYINANINPRDNLKIISLLSIKSWNERLIQQQGANNNGRNNNWLVIQSNNFYMCLYKVTDEYLLLLCCESEYPKGLALKKLENLSKALKVRL